MGYAKKGKDLWKMLDKTGSGFASVDEIDPKTAQVLAHFKKFVDERFNGYHAAFENLDLDGTRKIRLQQFQQGLEKFRFPFHKQAATLFAALDLDENHVIDEDDLHFLEKWSPLPFLTASPNPRAREEVRKLLIHRYGRAVKVWSATELRSLCDLHSRCLESRVVSCQIRGGTFWIEMAAIVQGPTVARCCKPHRFQICLAHGWLKTLAANSSPPSPGTLLLARSTPRSSLECPTPKCPWSAQLKNLPGVPNPRV